MSAEKLTECSKVRLGAGVKIATALYFAPVSHASVRMHQVCETGLFNKANST